MKRFARTVCLLLAALCLGAAGPAAAESASPKRCVVRFELVRSSDLPDRAVEVFRLGGGFFLSRHDGPAVRLDPSVAAALLRIADEHGLAAWDGFDGDNPDLLDGESFRLSLLLSDGVRAEASGSGAFPPGYAAATAAVDDLLGGIEASAAPLAGTYRLETGGFGGDFDLTIAADGTYTFYEGPLSSYLGGGSWSQWGAGLYLTERNGFALSFVLIPLEDALVFRAEGSDRFPCVDVPDGARFVRVGEGE